MFKAPNHTQVPNEFFEEIMPTLGFAEMKVLLVIMRKTLGWHKIRDRISISQLEKLAKLARRNVCQAVKKLVQKKLILKIVEGENGTQVTYYELMMEDDSNNSYQCRQESTPSITEIHTKETLTKENLSSTPSKGETPLSVRLVDFFHSEILKRKPNFTKKPTAKWKSDAEKLLKLRSAEEIHKIILWALDDPFWFANIQSPGALLRNLDRLEVRLSSSKCEQVTVVSLEQNKLIVEALKQKYSHRRDIMIGRDYVELGSGMTIDHIKTNEPSFKERVENFLRKAGLDTKLI